MRSVIAVGARCVFTNEGYTHSFEECEVIEQNRPGAYRPWCVRFDDGYELDVSAMDLEVLERGAA